MATIERVEPLLREEWTTSGELWLGQRGERLRNGALADMYARIVDEAHGATREARIDAARGAFYRGFVAEAILAAIESPAMDSSGERHAGVLSGDDLAGFSATVEEPLALDFRGWRVHKTGPWGQGPVFLQQLALIDELGEFLGAEHIHRVVEGAKLAFADREAWYGDSAPVPLDVLLSSAYAQERRALIGSEASGELRPGGPDPRLPDPVARRGGGRGGRADARRHLSPRRGRPLGQPRLRHAERRLAAIVARHPGAGVLPGHPGADVLAAGRAAGLAGGRPAPAHDAVAVAGGE